MELIICHGEVISNNIKNIHKVDATIIKANNVVRRVILVLIVLFPLSVVIYSIVIIGIVRTTIVKDNCSDALTITTTTTNNNIIVRTKD